jgi:hypothetical protein
MDPQKNKFTPGPWHTEQASDGHWMIHQDSNGIGHEVGLAHCKTSANATLIAESPAMYEILKRIRPFLRSYPDGLVSDEEIRLVDSIIAKAEGRQS